MKILRLSLALAAVTAAILPTLGSAQRRAPPKWPTRSGVFTATSSETIPLFPRAISGYRPTGNGLDYWGKRFESTGEIRVGDQWQGLPDFPVTMNHCSDGVFTIRWRTANPDVRIASMLASQDINLNYMPGNPVKIGRFGYMYGFNCVQPAFKFSRTVNGNSSNIDDIYYEVKFWRAAP